MIISLIARETGGGGGDGEAETETGREAKTPVDGILSAALYRLQHTRHQGPDRVSPRLFLQKRVFAVTVVGDSVEVLIVSS